MWCGMRGKRSCTASHNICVELRSEDCFVELLSPAFTWVPRTKILLLGSHNECFYSEAIYQAIFCTFLVVFTLGLLFTARLTLVVLDRGTHWSWVRVSILVVLRGLPPAFNSYMLDHISILRQTLVTMSLHKEFPISCIWRAKACPEQTADSGTYTMRWQGLTVWGRTVPCRNPRPQEMLLVCFSRKPCPTIMVKRKH